MCHLYVIDCVHFGEAQGIHLSVCRVSPTALQAFDGIISEIITCQSHIVMASHRGLHDQVHNPACGWGSSLLGLVTQVL